jgi:ferredoxin
MVPSFAQGLSAVFNTGMPNVRIVDRDQEIFAPPGEPVLFAMWEARVNIMSVCGGNCSCGTCNVEVVEGHEHLDPPHEGEQYVLSRIKRQGPNVRLSCQLMPRGDIAIRIRPEA